MKSQAFTLWTLPTYADVIRETAAYYHLGNRSVSRETGRCVYHGPDGRECAFSRVCHPGANLQKYDFGPSMVASNIMVKHGQEILSYRYQLLTNTHFWNDIQLLHDLDFNWTVSGLSESGHETVKQLIEKYPD